MTSAADTLNTEFTEWTLPSRGRVGMAGLIVTESALFSRFEDQHIWPISARQSLIGPYLSGRTQVHGRETPICLLSSSVTIMLPGSGLAKAA